LGCPFRHDRRGSPARRRQFGSGMWQFRLPNGEFCIDKRSFRQSLDISQRRFTSCDRRIAPYVARRGRSAQPDELKLAVRSSWATRTARFPGKSGTSLIGNLRKRSRRHTLPREGHFRGGEREFASETSGRVARFSKESSIPIARSSSRSRAAPSPSRLTSRPFAIDAPRLTAAALRSAHNRERLELPPSRAGRSRSPSSPSSRKFHVVERRAAPAR
jgi:hypothetical protein